MSKLRTARGDDHPEAAGKHLADADALLVAGRPDGAAYLSGYVVECSLKSLWLHQIRAETGSPMGQMPWRSGARGHDLTYLQGEVATLASVADARIARYVGEVITTLADHPVCEWTSDMRYRAPGIEPEQAQAWVTVAQSVYFSTVAQMWQDGVL